MSTEPKLIPLRIRLPYQTEEEFIDKYGSNVARGGVFIATRALKPEGTQLAFEFVLADGARLLRGDGVVVKNQVDEGGTRAGMTVRFVRLDAASKALIDRVVAHRTGVVAKPPEHVISSAPAVPRPSPPPASAAPASGPSATTAAEPSAPQPGASVPSSSGAPAATEAEQDSAAAAASTTAPAESAQDAAASAVPTSAPAEAAHDSAATAASVSAPAEAAQNSAAAAQPTAAPSEPMQDAPAPAAAPEASATEAAPLPAAADAPNARPRRRASLLELAAQAPVKTEAPEVVLGIDLGTTNARVAVYRDGAAQLVPLWEDGRTAMVSCAAVGEDGELVVGETAQDRMAHAPHEGVTAAKRLIGRRARARRVKEEATRVPWALVPDASGDAAVRLRDRVRSLTEISAALLSSLKAAAETDLGHAVTRAVLCVPAYFTDHQRQAMREAGRLAGLEVLRIFNEPSAVALAFGHGKALPRKRILVYDLGGGTFDATVVEVTGDELEAVANGGDNFLGGMDFDAKIAAALGERFAAAEKVSLDTSPIATLRLREASERAKISLSDAETTRVTVPGAALREGAPVALDLELTRAEMEAITDELVERTLQVTRDVLASANLSAQSLDEVLLVGGQSRSPKVRAKVEELVGRKVRTDVDAQAAVAYGAAILGHALIQASKGKAGVALSEVLSAPIGIATRDGGFRRVLERNTRLPAEKTILLPGKAGESLGVAVFQGTSDRADDNEYLGSLTATLEKNGELQVRFAVGSDGTLELTAAGPGGHRAATTLSTDDATDEVRAALYAAAPLPGEEDGGKKSVFGGIRKLFGRR